MLGLSNKAIASKLTVTVGTVKTHVKSILSKLGNAEFQDKLLSAMRYEFGGHVEKSAK
jgi:DNA-binding NarL/FixJ family response regulator